MNKIIKTYLKLKKLKIFITFEVNEELDQLGQLIQPYSANTEEFVKYHMQSSTSHSKNTPTAVTATRCRQCEGERLVISFIPCLSDTLRLKCTISCSGSAEVLRNSKQFEHLTLGFVTIFQNGFLYIVGSLNLLYSVTRHTWLQTLYRTVKKIVFGTVTIKYLQNCTKLIKIPVFLFYEYK